MSDHIDSPGNEDQHYFGSIQPKDFGKSWRLHAFPYKIVKYLCRYPRKGGSKDLEKALWCLDDIVLDVKQRGNWYTYYEGEIPMDTFFDAQELGVDERFVLREVIEFPKRSQVDLFMARNRLEKILKRTKESERVRRALCLSPRGESLPPKYPLLNERFGRTIEFRIFTENGPREGSFTVNAYSDGSPGEIFIDRLGKEGEEEHGWADAWAIAISKLFQYGVDPREVCDKFKALRFEPQGWTNLPQVRFCSSVPDLVMKYILATFINEEKKEDSEYNDIVDAATGGK